MVERQLYLYEYVVAPFEEVVRVVRDEGARVFESATEEAVSGAERVQADLVVDLGGFEVGREVEISVGELIEVQSMCVKTHLDWHASELSALFPSLSADLEIAALATGDNPLTQVTMVGHYDPPLGVLGALGDAVFGHRLAEAALHRFLNTTVDRLSDAARG